MLPETNNLLSKNQGSFNLLAKGSKNLRRGSFTISHNLLASFRYAIHGLFYGLRTQRNFRIHSLLGLLAFSLGIWLKLSFIDLSVLVLTVSSVLILELINTSIEAVVDLAIGRRFHSLARIAKDCSAAAVLVYAITSILIACFLLLPPLLIRMGFSAL